MCLGRYEPLGQGILAPCTKPIASAGDLIEEAKALWKAEHPKAEENRIGSSWGCIGVLNREEPYPKELLRVWAAYFRKNSTRPIYPVDAKGVLQIPWPETAKSASPADCDIILATATAAERTPPSVKDIAEAWIEQKDGYEEYFFENIRAGISTPEDHEIWWLIKERRPGWLKKPEYADAIRILDAHPPN